jgi:hypothetical protein
MERNLIVATWSWAVITILLEVVAAPHLASVRWQVRGSVESLIALSSVIPLMLVYMGLAKEHISLKMFFLVSLFFCTNLILIWSASLVH